MATFDLSEFLEDDTLVLEGIASEKHPGGKAYRFASPSAKVGLWLKNLVEFGVRTNLARAAGSADDELPPVDLGKLVLDDDEERDLYQRVMGDTYDEMIADGVSHARVQKVFTLLLRHYGTGSSIDAQLAEAGRPEAAGPGNRAERRARQTKAGSSSSRASTATPARRPARTSTRSSGTSGSSRRAATA